METMKSKFYNVFFGKKHTLPLTQRVIYKTSVLIGALYIFSEVSLISSLFTFGIVGTVIAITLLLVIPT